MIQFPIHLLSQYCQENSISLSPSALQQFADYGNFLLETNEKVNLTAITDPTEVVIKHFIDSLSLLTVHKPTGRLLDVGSGAGFPGIPLKLVFPELEVCLLDSLRKRLDFIDALNKQLNITTKCYHMRAEDGGQNPSLRETFDTVTARAVANLSLLAEYCLPFVKQGGVMIAMKGPSCLEELATAERPIQLLGGKLQSLKEIILPDGSQRVIIVIKKISQTPTRYPRVSSIISKLPL